MPKRTGVYFTLEEIEALTVDLEGAYEDIGERLIDGEYGDDNGKAERLHRKLGRILGVTQ